MDRRFSYFKKEVAVFYFHLLWVMEVMVADQFQEVPLFFDVKLIKVN
jgi:hypothetical protein